MNRVFSQSCTLEVGDLEIELEKGERYTFETQYDFFSNVVFEGYVDGFLCFSDEVLTGEFDVEAKDISKIKREVLNEQSREKETAEGREGWSN